MSTEQLIDSLKRVLKSLFSQRTFTLNRLEQVLTAL